MVVIITTGCVVFTYITMLLRRWGDAAARRRVLRNIAEIDPEQAAEAAADVEFEAFFGPQIWREIEEMSARPSIVEMTTDLSTDLSALPPQVAAAVMLRPIGRKTDATAVLSGEIIVDEAMDIVIEAQVAAHGGRDA
jgi:hypothetical protein